MFVSFEVISISGRTNEGCIEPSFNPFLFKANSLHSSGNSNFRLWLLKLLIFNPPVTAALTTFNAEDTQMSAEDAAAYAAAEKAAADKEPFGVN